MWPNVVHHTILDCLQNRRIPEGLFFERHVSNPFFEKGTRIVGVQAEIDGKPDSNWRTSVVIGADGPFSQVREAMGISCLLSTDTRIVTWLRHWIRLRKTFMKRQYYVGQKTILGLFPAPWPEGLRLIYGLFGFSSPGEGRRGVSPRFERNGKRIAPEVWRHCLIPLWIGSKRRIWVPGRVRAKNLGH